MKKRIFALILCIIIFCSALGGSAFAEVLEKPLQPSIDTLPGALLANNKTAVLYALKNGKAGDCGVIVDLDNFTAVVLAPADPQMYYQMYDMSNRVLISFFINPKADSAKAIEKDKNSFYYSVESGVFKGSYGVKLALDANNLKLPERKPSEFDPILDSALFVREVGFYDVNGNVCSACASYTTHPEEHSVLPCGVHMGCIYDMNDITHYTVCQECGRTKCSCYCNNYMNNTTLLSITGSGHFAVAGKFHKNIALSFDKDAKVVFYGEGTAPVMEVTPEVDCFMCGKTQSLAAASLLDCGAHYACPECQKKLTPAEYSKHYDELECGHYACDGKQHSTEIYSEYCPYELPHHKCEGYDPTHHCDACGKDFACEEGLQHSICYVCSRNVCIGDHTTCDYCGGRICDGNIHGIGACSW